MTHRVSSRKGNQTQKIQKHKNTVAFDPERYTKASSIQIPMDQLCVRCIEIIQWRRQYNKYKPLTQAKRCVGCDQKSIKEAYHILCKPCARGRGLCAKCQLALIPSEEEEDQVRQQQQEDVKDSMKEKSLLASMSERVRRTYLRKLERDGPEAVQSILDKLEAQQNEAEKDFLFDQSDASSLPDEEWSGEES